ncbi:MAG TPA: winged helix-turn-helix domain-containing protein [Candidatus Acidoferrales bacterium]|nr:winged helix-turn-helix domain-containing protein [Candidatus Acidoferrales bacterium]
MNTGFLRFGVFEANLPARELRKHGIRLKLRGQPFEILALLLEKPGEIVTREEMQKRLWPADTYVDFEHSVNTAMKKLRAVLGDSPENSRYIETVPRVGYRFIAPVTELQGETGNAEARVLPRPTTDWARWPFYVLTAALLVAGTLYVVHRWWPLRQQPQGRALLAVLPFQNLSGDPEQDYFSDGLTEEMIAQLGRLNPDRLGVIARTSVMHYKHSQEQLEQIGRELGVQYVLEGSVRRDSDKVRVTAQLIQMKDQTHLWGRQYDREVSSLLALQGEIAQEIADEIQLTLGDRRRMAADAKPAASPSSYEAYDLYLKGQYFWNKRTVQGFQQAIEHFQQAITKDANYARAYAGLADSYALIGGYSSLPQTEFMPKARAAALRALEIDENLPEAHTALALIVQNYDWDWQTSEKEFRRAIELDPNYATAHHWYAEHLAWRGRFDEAFRESERARQLDPLSLIIATDNGAILYYSRQYDRAIGKFSTVLDMDPNFPRAGLILEAYIQKGMFVEAGTFYEKHKPSDVDAPWYWSSLAYLNGRSGRSAQARRALETLLQLNRRRQVDAKLLIAAYIGVGNKDQALAWLEKAYAQHSNAIPALKVDPMYDPLRSDPRFQDLLRRVGLADSKASQ